MYVNICPYADGVNPINQISMTGKEKPADLPRKSTIIGPLQSKSESNLPLAKIPIHECTRTGPLVLQTDCEPRMHANRRQWGLGLRERMFNHECSGSQ
jgi:hypothetical protein